MTATIPQQQTAAYIAESRAVLLKLAAALDTMEATPAPHYGHVGDARHVAERLGEIFDFVRPRHD